MVVVLLTGQQHLDLLLFNALMDEEVMHCNVLGLLVVSRVLSKAERAFVVTKQSHLVDMKTDRIKQILDKNHFTAGIRQSHELSILRGAGNQVNNLRPPSDGSPIEHQSHAGCRLQSSN